MSGAHPIYLPEIALLHSRRRHSYQSSPGGSLGTHPIAMQYIVLEGDPTASGGLYGECEDKGQLLSLIKI